MSSIINEKPSVTRRSMIKGAGATMAGVAALGLTSAAVAEEASGNVVDVDIVVVGNGIAGMVAAIHAQELGASVAIVDKRGAHGNSYVAGGTFAMPQENTPESIEDYVYENTKKSAGRGDDDLMRATGERIYEAVAWLEGYGAQIKPPAPMEPMKVVGRTVEPAMYQGMPLILDGLQEVFEGNGGQTIIARVRSLVCDPVSGRVIGVDALGKDGMVRVQGTGVIVASGGYAGNKEMLERYMGPNADEMMVRGHTYMTGDLLPICQNVGAALVQMGGLESVHVAAVHPDNTAAGNCSGAIPYSIAINAAGKRFIDESLGYVRHGKAVAEQDGVWDSVIFDTSIMEANAAVPTVIDQFDRLSLPVLEADSLADLAEIIGVDAAALEATVEEFNAACQPDGSTSGLEVEKSALAAPLVGPKFYAFSPLRPGVTLTFGGIKADVDSHVLTSDGEPIPGLYAAGEVIGGYFVDDYVGGDSLARSVVTGLISAESAVAGV